MIIGVFINGTELPIGQSYGSDVPFLIDVKSSYDTNNTSNSGIITYGLTNIVKVKTTNNYVLALTADNEINVIGSLVIDDIVLNSIDYTSKFSTVYDNVEKTLLLGKLDDIVIEDETIDYVLYHDWLRNNMSISITKLYDRLTLLKNDTDIILHKDELTDELVVNTEVLKKYCEIDDTSSNVMYQMLIPHTATILNELKACMAFGVNNQYVLELIPGNFKIYK